MTKGPILVVAAHPDDEVLGCGGYMAREAQAGRKVHVLILADGETARGSGGQMESRRNAASRAAAALGVASLTMHDLPDNRLDSVALLDIVQKIEAKMAEVGPSTVLTHHHGDVNIDHRVAHAAVLVACRPLPSGTVKELFFFEVPSSTEWQPAAAAAFLPTVFADISGVVQIKEQALLAYAAELRPFPHPRSIEAVDALAAWRGATAGVARAEAFVLGRALM